MKTPDLRPQVAKLVERVSALAMRRGQAQSPLAMIVVAGLLATTAGSLLFALYGIFGPIGGGDVAKAPEWKPPSLAVVDLDPPKPPSADVQTLSRPIFSKTRRQTPKAAATPASAVATEPPVGMTVGAIVSNKKTRQAFLLSQQSPDGAWRKVGDVIDAWTVSSISPGEVILKSGAQTVRLRLYTDSPPASFQFLRNRPFRSTL